jgi:alpha-amylase
MKSSYSPLRLFFVLFLLTACVASPAPETATIQPSPTEPSSPTQTPTLEPTDTPEPTPTSTSIPLPTVAVTPVQPVTGLPQGTDGFPWWNDTVFYEIFVRSFYDTDGDGIGDFNGITAKLDYLNDGDPATMTDLGVTGLWLMPIHPSPSYHGYDVTDYYAVNPQYGTMEDFKRLLDEAHKRGIRITIDWVLNHTSNQHPWFEQAKDAESPYRDWYRWTTEQFPGPGWRYGGGGASYYANFSEAMPDLNYVHPAVKAEMKKVVNFWLNDVGIDGFRLDGAKHIFEDGQITENAPETHAWYKELRSYYKGIAPQVLTVGEVADDSETVSAYIQGYELDLAFDFDLARTIVFSAGVSRADDVNDVLRKDLSLFQPGQFATFLTNHDQERTMSVLNDDVEAGKNAAILLLTSPGVPFLYYGEEIGMVGKKPDEDIRRPLQWSAEDDAGFTTGAPWRAPFSDYTTKNIATQSEDPNSLLSLYRKLIHLRNEHAALRVGDHYFVETGHPAVYASLRVSQEETILILINLGSETVGDYALNLEGGPLVGEYLLAPLLDNGQITAPAISDQGGFENYQPVPAIPPYGRFIFQLQPQTK